jgi:hypothetical protein
MAREIPRCTLRKADGSPCRAWAVRGTTPPSCRKHTPPEKLQELDKSTSPWNAEDNPWSLDLLRLKKQRPGFRAKWINRDNLQKHLDIGYNVASIQHYGGMTDKLPGEEGKIDTTVRRREMILVEISEDLAKKRDQYMHWRANRAIEAAQNIAQDEGKELKRSGQNPHMETEFSERPGGF